MANTLNVQERTLAQISESTNTINLIDQTGAITASPRKSVYQPITCRVTDHDDDNGATGDDYEGMAIFVQARHGEPWIKEHGLQHIVINADADPVSNATNSGVTVLFPNFDYSTFQ